MLSDTTLQTNEPSHNSGISTDEITYENKISETDSNFSKKKKSSLLRRRASEPRLDKLNSNNDLPDEIVPQFTTIEIDPEDYTNLKGPQVIDKRVIRKSFKERTLNERTDKIIRKHTDMESAYNEIFFYNFENVLIEFIDKNYKLNP